MIFQLNGKTLKSPTWDVKARECCCSDIVTIQPFSAQLEYDETMNRQQLKINIKNVEDGPSA